MPNSIDLTSAAAVETESGISAADLALARQITAASQAITTYLARGALTYATGVVEKVAGYGNDRLLVARTPIVSITSIVLEDGTTVTSTEYEIEDANAGIIRRISSAWPFTGRCRAGIVQDLDVSSARPTITVTLTGGWKTPGQVALSEASPSTLPADIEQACIETVVTWYRRRRLDRGIASESVGAASVSYRNPNSLIGVGPGHLPDSALALLSPYRRLIG